MRLFILLFPLRDSYGTLCFKKVLYGKIQIDFGTGSFETFYFIVPFTRLIWRMYPIKENIAESRKVVHRYYLFVSASERFMFEQKNIARKSICSYVKQNYLKLVQRKEEEKLRILLTACQDQIAFVIVCEYISKYWKWKEKIL